MKEPHSSLNGMLAVTQLPYWSIRHALKLFFIIFILPMLLLLGLVLVVKLSPDFKAYLHAHSFISILYYGISAFYILAIAFIINSLKGRPHLSRDLGLNRFSFRTAFKYWLCYPLYYFTVLLLFIGLIVGISHLIGHPLTAGQLQPKKSHDSFNWSLFVLGVFCAPLIEELFFRGILLPAFAKKYGWAKGSVYSSLMFSLIHGPVAPFIMIFSLYQCRLYYRTGSIIPGILLHMANNAFVFSLVLVK